MPTIQDSKLVRLLRMLSIGDNPKSDDQIKEFRRWLESPWSNTNRNVSKLFKLLIPYHPHFDDPLLTREWISKKIFNAAKDKQTRNLMVSLARQVEKFLIHSELQADHQLQHRLLTKINLERGAFEKGLEMIQSEIKTVSAFRPTGSSKCLDLFQLGKALFGEPHGIFRNQPGGQQLRELGHNLDQFYALNLGYILTEKMNRTNIMNTQESNSFYFQIQYLQALSEKYDNPALSLYAAKLQGDLDFQTFKQRFLTVRPQLDIITQRNFLLLLINEALALRFKGNTQITKDIFELYKIGIQTKSLFHYGYLTERTFFNTIISSTLAGELEFAQNFATNYLPYLTKEFQKDAGIWAEAYLLRNRSQYEASISLMVNHTFTTFAFNLLGRILCLKSYFDLYQADQSYFQFLTNYTESFEKWLRREQMLSQERKLAHLNFIKYVKRIIRVETEERNFQEKFQAIAEELSLEKAIISKQWLEEILQGGKTVSRS